MVKNGNFQLCKETYKKSIKNPRKENDISKQNILETKNNDKEICKMEISVKGMMCGHCEMHVKKALEAVDGIANVSASHETGTVTFETSNEVDEKLIKKAVTDAGYEYCGKCWKKKL